MKKKYGLVTALILCLLFDFAGCSSFGIRDKTENQGTSPIAAADTEDEKARSAPQVIFEKEQKDRYSDDKSRWLVHAEYARVSVEGDGYEEISENVEKWSKERIRKIQDAGGTAAAQESESETQAHGEEDSYLYSIYEDLELGRADSRVVSILGSYSWSLDDLNEGCEFTGYTFDSQSGQRLELGDIVNDMDKFYQAAWDYIAEELKRQYEDGSFWEYADTALNPWTGNGEVPVWYLDAAGITFVFQPDMNMGEAYVTLPYREFAEYISLRYIGFAGAGTAQVPRNMEIPVDLGAGREMQDTVCVLVDENEEGWNLVSLQVNGVSREIDVAGWVEDIYLLSLPDGRRFILLCMDYMSDDYVTFLYEVTDGNIRESDRLEGANPAGENMNTDILSLNVHLDVLGTYLGRMDYRIDGEGKLCRMSEVYEIPVDSWEWHILTVVKELPVTMDGQETVLPIGSRIRIIGTDNSGTAYFREEPGGKEGSISYIRGGEEDSGMIYIDGVPDYDYFEMLPYAG